MVPRLVSPHNLLESTSLSPTLTSGIFYLIEHCLQASCCVQNITGKLPKSDVTRRQIRPFELLSNLRRGRVDGQCKFFDVVICSQGSSVVDLFAYLHAFDSLLHELGDIAGETQCANGIHQDGCQLHLCILKASDS